MWKNLTFLPVRTPRGQEGVARLRGRCSCPRGLQRGSGGAVGLLPGRIQGSHGDMDQVRAQTSSDLG